MDLLSFARLGVLGIGFQYIFLKEDVDSVYWVPWVLQSCYLVVLIWEVLMKTFRGYKDNQEQHQTMLQKILFFLGVYTFFTWVAFVVYFLFVKHKATFSTSSATDWSLFGTECALFFAICVLNWYQWKQVDDDHIKKKWSKSKATETLSKYGYQIILSVLAVEHIILTHEYYPFHWWSLVWASFVVHFLATWWNLSMVAFVVDTFAFGIVFFIRHKASETVWKIILFGTMLVLSTIEFYHSISSSSHPKLPVYSGPSSVYTVSPDSPAVLGIAPSVNLFTKPKENLKRY